MDCESTRTEDTEVENRNSDPP